jgi:hypothetical protein
MQAFAAGTYAVSLSNQSLSGQTLSINGLASAVKFAGLFSQYHVDVTWGDGSTSVDAHNLTESVDGKDFSGSWSGNHTYTTSGSKTIVVALCHQSCTGAEGADATVTLSVVIPTQCSDGIDNSDTEDTLVDMNDPGCSGPTDDDEFNTVVQMRTLTVNKTLITNNGSTAAVGQFGFQVNGGPLTSFEPDGSNDVSLAEGTAYTVTEPATPGFTASLSPSCSGTLGSTGATCTITNDDIPATLTLVKQIANGGPAVATDWTLSADGAVTDISGVTGNAAVTNASVNAGTYTLSESTGPARYNPGAWVCTGVANTGDQITLANGESATCTITNTYVPPAKASITVFKTVVNNFGGTATVDTFKYWVNGATEVFHDVAAMFDAVPPTLFTLTETNTTGYTAGAWGGNCNVNGTVTLAEGQSAICEITNNDIQPKLTVSKVVVNDDGTADSVAADFDLFVGGTQVISGAVTGFNAGTYILSETGDTTGDYSASYSCVKNGGDSVPGNSITLAVGDVATCTITNDDLDPTEAKITVNKTVVNGFGGDAVASDFSFTINDGEPIAFEEDGSNDIIVTTAGQYSIVETAAPGYEAAPVGTCSNFSVALGQSYSCSITNTELSQCNDGIDNDQDGFSDYDNGEDSDVGCTGLGDDTETDPVGSITIDKVVTGEGASSTQAFNFNYGWTESSSDVTISAASEPVVINNLAPGQYSITELALPSQWRLSDITCVDADDQVEEVVSTDGGLVLVNLSLGENVKCTYTNNYTPRDSGGNTENIVVRKLVTEGSDTSKLFTFEASWEESSFQLGHGMTHDSGDLAADEVYSVAEIMPALWEEEAVVCVSSLDDEESARKLSPQEFVLMDGETITCTFTNNEEFVTLNVVTSGDGEGVVTTDVEQEGGINCDSEAVESNCSQIYPRGAVVGLTATPDSGSNFNNSWAVGAGTCTGNNTPCSVTMTSSLSLNAHFDRNGGGGGGTRVDRTPDGDVLGDSDDREPVGAVLGEQVDAVPTGAPNTGKGGASTVALVQFLAIPRRRNTAK